MAIFSPTRKEVVRVADRSGSHRAHKLDAIREHYHGKFQLLMVGTTSNGYRPIGRRRGLPLCGISGRCP
jgi:hypothetical protein